jgi:transcriptional antiterminator RfaH
MLTSNNWHVLYTMPKQERKVADELAKKRFEVFLPLYKTIRQWSDRKKLILAPLFPSYVFVNTSYIERMRVFEIPGVVRFLSTKGKLDSISREEIILIQNILDNNPEVHRHNLQRGDLVRVISGPFKGLKGEIENINGRCRLSLWIESLHQIVKFDISSNVVESIPRSVECS